MNTNCTIHYPNEQDSEVNLCGSVCTRDDPQTTGDEVTCLKCLILKEAKNPQDL